MAGHLIRGERKPGPNLRKRIREAYGLVWGKASKSSPSPSSTSSNSVESAEQPSAERSIREMARDLRRSVDTLIAETNRADISPSERGRAARAAAVTLATLRKIEGHELSERIIVEHPAFQRAVAMFLEAIKPWPEAIAAGGRALAKLAQEDGRG